MSFLAISINGQFLSLTKDTSISFSRLNPLFQTEVIPGVVSLPFKIAMSPENMLILGNPQLPSIRRTSVSKFNCVIWLDGNPWIEGLLSVAVGDDNMYEADFTQIGEFAEYAKKSIRTLKLGGPRDYSGVVNVANDFHNELYSRANKSIRDYVCFPVYAPNYFDNESSITHNSITPSINVLPANYLKYQNYYFYRHPSFSNPTYPSQGYFHTDMWDLTQLVISPFVYVKYIIECIFNEMGYTIDASELLNDAEIADLTVYTNKHIMMRIDWTGSSWFASLAPLIFNLGDLLPDISISEFLNNFCETFNAAIFFDQRKKSVYIEKRSSILNTKRVTDISSNLLSSITWTEEEQTGFKLIRNLSDPLASELVKTIDEVNVLPPVANFASLPTVGVKATDVCLVIDENMYYQCDVNYPSVNWVFYSYNLFSAEIGTEPTDLSISTELLLVVNNIRDDIEALVQNSLAGYYWNVPKTLWKNSDKIPLTFMFYRGILEYPAEAFGYPYGSFDELNTLGVDVFNYSLRLTGEKGIYNMWYKEWLQFLLFTRTEEAKLHSEISDLLSPNHINKYRIGSNTYLVKEDTITVDTDGIRDTKATLCRT